MAHLFLLLVALLLISARATAVHARASVLEEASFAGIRGVIGSRPPSCEGRCRSCGHCEAVQVPISPQELQRRKKKDLGHGSRAAAATGGRAVQVPISPQELQRRKKEDLGHGSRAAAATGGRAMPASYDDHSNYKPLSWRCKCGRHILDP